MSELGRETSPAIEIPIPPLRFYPGPAVFWPFALLFSAGVALAVLTGRFRMSPGFYWFLTLMASLMLLGAIFTTIRRARMRVTMSLREHGFTFAGGGRAHSIRYDDVESFTMGDTPRYDNFRTVVALNRTIDIAAAHARIRSRYIAMPSSDPLDALLEEVVQRLARNHNRRGEGWSIENETLVTRNARMPLPTISAAGVFDGEVRIWQHGGSQHSFAVPVSTRNARVLLQIAKGAQSSQPAPARAPVVASTDDNDPGRLLFTRRTSLASVLFIAAAMAGAIWLGVLSAQKFAPQFADLARKLAPAAYVLAGVYAIHRLTTRYRVHERAITRATLLGNRTLAFGDVASMTWKESSVFLEHAFYLGTSMSVTLASNDRSPLRIKLHRFRATDDDLLPMRDAIAEHIATRLYREVRSGSHVTWTHNAIFTPTGLEVKTGLLGGGGREVLAYGVPVNMRMAGGYLVLFRDSFQNPITTLPAAAKDFYPGLALFARMSA